MSQPNTVTLSLDRYHQLLRKEKAIDTVESDPDAYIVFQISNYWALGISKHFSGVDHGALNRVLRENTELQKQNRHLEKLNEELKNVNAALHDRKPWYQIW